jgi:hypothetical protein
MFSQQLVERLLERPWRGRSDRVATRKATLKKTFAYESVSHCPKTYFY